GTVTLVASYSCGDVTKTFAVDGAPAAPVVAPADACPNTAQTYFITNVVNTNTYSWTTSGDVNDAYCTNGGMYQVTVTDLSGRVLMNNDLKANSGRNHHEIDLGFVNAGLYMIYVKDAAGTSSVHKVAVE
ncbi:MAG: T9SS type A sorting domain-containing protein, partial [Bacteroidota bacterium]|nr:T9SS type A sorting domain-containing protein [Bacteroidota bacterium]